MHRLIKLPILLLSTLLLLLPENISADQSTTFTYGINRKGYFVQTQDAYLPDRNITSLNLSGPEDMAFSKDDILYIADKGNRRIVLYDINRDLLIREIKHPDFKAPRGVFITPDNFLYVADSSAGAVFCFNAEDECVRIITKPDSAAFGDTPFSPYRVAADARGNLYLICEGVYNGIVQLSGAGEFLGYFASNKALLTFTQLMQDIFFTDRQKEGLADRLPLTFSNVYADSRGVVYSASMGRENMGLKKHNMAGKNMLPAVWTTISTTDVTADKNGVMYTSDIGGYIGVYADDGSEIFVFGRGRRTDEDIAGMYKSLMSIAVSQKGHIWTLDSEKAFLQSFTPTEYAESIFRALLLFNEGRYAEAGAQWQNVLRFNQMSVLAHNGLGKSYLYQQQYLRAQEEFSVAGNRYYYSQAFWETRNQWLMDNLAYGLIILVVVMLFFTGLKYLDREHKVKTVVRSGAGFIVHQKRLANLFFAFQVIRHPLDSYYYMKRREKGSGASAAFFFVLFFVSYMVYQTSKAYILQYLEIEDMDFNVVIGGFFGIAALFVFSNYLVTSINDGEGSISDIFKILSYASLPLSAALLLVTLLTYVITLNEVFMVNFILAAGFIWAAVILYLGLQEIHNYSFRNTIKSIVITAAFMLIALVVLFNLTILFGQFTQFLEAFIRELIANVSHTY